MIDGVLTRTFDTYKLLSRTVDDISEEFREKLSAYLKTLFEAGVKDEDRLTVCGLTFLRQLDGKIDHVKAGFTGL